MNWRQAHLWLEELLGRELLMRLDDERWRRGEIQRQRKLDTAATLWLMLNVALETGRRGLHEILRLGLGIPPPGAAGRVSKAAFSKARARFSPPEPSLPPPPPDPVPVPPLRRQPRPLARPHPQGHRQGHPRPA